MAEVCEGCGKPAGHYDREYVPLCAECLLGCDIHEEEEADG